MKQKSLHRPVKFHRHFSDCPNAVYMVTLVYVRVFQTFIKRRKVLNMLKN